MTDSPLNIPIEECAAKIEALWQQVPNAIFYQKFTCDNCGSRQTVDQPNMLFASGRCGECQHVTDLTVKGCGFLVHMGITE